MLSNKTVVWKWLVATAIITRLVGGTTRVVFLIIAPLTALLLDGTWVGLTSQCFDIWHCRIIVAPGVIAACDVSGDTGNEKVERLCLLGGARVGEGTVPVGIKHWSGDVDECRRWRAVTECDVTPVGVSVEATA